MDEDIFSRLRPYQHEAVDSIISSLIKGQKRFLLSMATGTGKNIVTLAIIKNFIESNLVRKVIYIVDRRELQFQMLDYFQRSMPYSCSIDKDEEFSFFFITSSRKLLLDEKYKNIYNVDKGVLLIFDNITVVTPGLQKIKDYYKDCYILGLSSNLNPPSFQSSFDAIYKFQKTSKEILSFLNLEKPTFSYSIKQAVIDGYLLNPYMYSDKKFESFDDVSNEITHKATELLEKLDVNSNVLYEINQLLSLIKYTSNSLKDSQELFSESLKDKLTEDDIKSLIYKKEQLRRFESLLYDEEYFETEQKNHKGPEAVWQNFFEQNIWIFGYGLNCIICDSLENKKLEQVVSGFNVNQPGKRVDALLKTRGLISSLCFSEIKTHKSPLLGGEYRSGCWSMSSELIGGISQIQKTVQSALQDLKSKIVITNKEGDPTGEVVFNYSPKSYLVVGNLNEFRNEHGVNEIKYSSFEIFRKNVSNPEIITFDELYERAKYIVENIEEIDMGHQ